MGAFSFSIPDQHRSPEAVEVAVKLLEHYIDSKDGIITYGDLCKKLSFDISPRNIEKLLGDVSYTCKENGVPPLSALVVNKGENRPGDGFFHVYFPGEKREKWDMIWLEVYNKIRLYNDWEKVLETYRSYL